MRDQIYADLEAERVRQDGRRSGPDHDRKHTTAYWGLILSMHYGLVMKLSMRSWRDIDQEPRGPSRRSDSLVRGQLVKVAAICVAWIERIDEQPDENLEPLP